MNASYVPLSDSGLYAELMMDYIEGHPQLRPFYSFSPAMATFEMAMEVRKKFPIHRQVLATELKIQHKDYFSRFPKLEQQIHALNDENTFTVTTGHQLCLATGPLYFIYKIISTVKLAHELSQKYPHCHFVPVYWMASEDHDIDEINHLHLFNESLKWETRQQGGSGRLSTEGLQSVLDDIERLCAHLPFCEDILMKLKAAYLDQDSLSGATRQLVLSLFGDYGLLVIDADSAMLKKLFAVIIKEELSLQPSFEIVNRTTEKLSHHYKTQLNPREINLFYLGDQLRERIIKDDSGHYNVINTDLRFSRAFILDLVDKQPEHFSPNVVLRPLYQETILPNLAYIGGPGEIAYWLQLKEIFEHYNVFFPMLVPRNNAVVLPTRALEKFINLGFEVKDIFRGFDDLSKQWLSGQEELSAELESARQDLRGIFEKLSSLFQNVDATLATSVQSELQKALNGMEQLEKKGNAALKRKHEVALNQVRVVLEKVSPKQHVQERYVNFIQFYAQQGPGFIRELFNQLQPLAYNVAVFTD